MAEQTRTARRERWRPLLVAPAITAALGLLTAVVADLVDPSAPLWQLARPVALLAAGWIPVRLAFEAAAYCAHTAERPPPSAVRTTQRGSGALAALAPHTYNFGRASLPGRDALPTGGART